MKCSMRRVRQILLFALPPIERVLLGPVHLANIYRVREPLKRKFTNVI